VSQHANRVQMTVSGSPGTGPITLASATAGYQSFGTAYGADATVDILIVEGNNWEVCRNCLYTHATPSVDRGTREASSAAGGGAVSFGTGAIVSVIATADFGNRMESTARRIAVFTPLDNQPPASNFATLDTRNSVAVLDFDAGTDEFAVFVGEIPAGVDLSGGIQVVISWAATSATSGDCVWSAEFEKTTGQDIDSDSFDTATTATTTTSGTSGVVNTATITCTAIDSLTNGDVFRVRISRDANAGGDTMTGDAELVTVELTGVA
jgi:hypothetical protein